MSTNKFRTVVTVVWLVAIALALSARIVFGGAPTIFESAGWLLLSLVPLYVAWSVFRAAPPTVAQILYDAEHVGMEPASSPIDVPRS